MEKLVAIKANSNLLAACVAFLLLYFQAITLSRIINRDKLMSKYNQLAAMSYLLITSFFSEWNMLSSALIANTILLQVWSLISRLQNTQSPKTLLFYIGLWIGISNFFYTFSFPFLLIAFIGLITYRAFQLREYLVILVGFVLPFYCLFFYQYLNDSFSPSNFKLLLNLYLPKFTNGNWVLVSVILIGLLVLIGLFTVQTQSNKMNIQARKSWSILFFYFLIALFTPLFSADFGYWILCLIPSAAFIGAGFLYMPNLRLKSGLHWAAFAFALYITYFL